MDSPNPIPTATPAPAGALPAAAALPWEAACAEDTMPRSTPAALRRRASGPRPGAAPVATPIPWSIVALAAMTAAVVIFSAQPGRGTQPQELLPVMVTAPAR